jgi:hypothetical protein
MIKLTKTSNAWKNPDFKTILKGEIEQIDAGQLPLQQGLSTGSFASDDNVTVVILGVSDETDFIHAKTGIFYTSLIPGCNCADDPTPNEEYNEYCEVLFDINKITAETEITLVAE